MNTVFIGKELIRLQSVDSTNTYAGQMLRKNMLSDGAVVVTFEQKSGRGQRGNQWESSAGENLTMSFVLKSWELALSEQFKLSMVVGLGILSCLNHYQEGFKLKWPNDVLFHNRKIAGVLIENVIKGNRIDASIVGIGINLNQTKFQIDTAISLTQITNRPVNIDDFLANLLEHIEAKLIQFRTASFEKVKGEYVKYLYGFEEEVEILINETQTSHKAKVVDVETSGKLLVETDGELRTFDLKEISFKI